MEQVFTGEPLIPVQMIAIGVLIMGAYIGGRLTAGFGLSEVTGQMIGGILVGPYFLHQMHILGSENHVYDHAIHALHFFVFIYLCLIAFGIGEELHLNRLKKVGKKALLIGSVHSAITFVFIWLGLWLIGGMELMDSLLVASVGMTSAPAITFVLMNRLRVEGHLRHLVGNVLVLTDLVGVLMFSLLVQVALKGTNGSVSVPDIALPVLDDFFKACLLGVGVFFLLRLLVQREASGYDTIGETDEEKAEDDGEQKQRGKKRNLLAARPSPTIELLAITTGVVSIGAGLAYLWHLPFLITAIVAGFIAANFHSLAVFDSLKIGNIAELLNLFFFALVGATMVLSSTDPHIYWLAGIYVVARLAGKYLGIYAACKIAGENSNVTRTMPSQLIPQTGVAAVEAVFLAQTLGKPELAGIILPGIVFFGIAGVVQVERALKRFLVREREEEAEAERHLHAQPPSGKVRAARKLLSYLVPESIMLGLQGSNKMEVIETMVDHALEVTHQHIDREQALQVLAEREDLAPTGLGHGIAMPHCRLIGLDEAVVIIGRHEEGVVFGGIDNEPCNIILLMCSSGRAAGEHLQLMAAVGHLLGSSTIREKILDAENAKEVMQVLIDTAELGEEAAEAANSTGGGRSTAEVNQTAG